MNEKDYQEIIERYNRRLKEFGYSIKTLAAGTPERRNIRFKILTEIGNFENKSVLDIGCGFADFIRFLNEEGITCSYTGYDINAELLSVAKNVYPSGQFIIKDIFHEDFPAFDYIVSSTTFNNRYKYEKNYELVDKLFQICFGHAREGVAIDFLTSYVDYQVRDAFYYEPERLFSLAKKYTRRVVLRHDYPLYEFCIYMYKEMTFSY
jgi:SAM-dependent methyltransferase